MIAVKLADALKLIERMRDAIKNLDHHGVYAHELRDADASLAAPPAQGELDVMEMRLCESSFIALRPDRLYRFTVDPECEACRKAAALYDAPQPAPAPVQVDEDCGCYTETTWADGFEAIEEVSCAKHAQPPAPGEAEGHIDVLEILLGEYIRAPNISAALRAAIAALAQQRVHVSDEMVERACKKYAFREDGALFPDDYSPHEVAAERVLMREFLTHVINQQQEARGNGE